jgi:short-subunit dehydrogenase
LGVIYGSRIATAGMLAQGHGSIYNMEGMGSDGRKHSGLALYGTTKYAIAYFTDCLAQELKDTPLVVGALRPGMVSPT